MAAIDIALIIATFVVVVKITKTNYTVKIDETTVIMNYSMTVTATVPLFVTVAVPVKVVVHVLAMVIAVTLAITIPKEIRKIPSNITPTT